MSTWTTFKVSRIYKGLILLNKGLVIIIPFYLILSNLYIGAFKSVSGILWWISMIAAAIPNNTLHWSATVMTPPRKYCILDVIKRLKNQSRLVKTGRTWSKLVKTGWNWSKLVKIVKTGQNLKWPSLFKDQQDLYLNISEPNFSSI